MIAVAIALLALSAISAPPTAAAQEPAGTDTVEANIVDLHPGTWNQTTWVGAEVGLVGIFRAVPEVQYAYAWNAEERTWYFAIRDGFTTGGWLQPEMHIFLWIAEEETVEWRQEAYVPPVLNFDSDIPEYLQAQAREEVRDVMGFFAERYGVRASGLTIHYESPGSCRAGALVIHAITDDAPGCFAHEYGHILHDIFSNDMKGFVHHIHHWLVEGIANYFDNVGWGGWRNYYESYDDYLQDIAVPKLRDANDPWPGYDEVFGVKEPNRPLSQMAIVHLVDLIGEEVFLNGLAEPPRLADEGGSFSFELWERREELSFENAFGITWEAFLESFATYRESFGPVLPSITGRVVGTDGRAAEGVEVWLLPQKDGLLSRYVTGEDGTFRLTLLRGAIEHILSVPWLESEGYGVEHAHAWNICSTRHEGDITEVTINMADRPEVAQDGVWDPELLPDCVELGLPAESGDSNERAGTPARH